MQSADINVCNRDPCTVAEGRNCPSLLHPSLAPALHPAWLPLAPCTGEWVGKRSWRNALCRLACYRAQWKSGGCIRCLRAFPLCNNLSLFFNVVVTLWLNQYLQFVSSPGCNKIVFQVLKHPIKVCKAVVLTLSHS